MITIRQAVYEDIPRIMDFIAKEWDFDHILGHDRGLFEWQYVDGHEVHFIIAEDCDTGKMYGMMGYNLLNHSEHPDVSTGMKLALKNPDYELLGEELSICLRKEIPFRISVSPGVRERYAKALRLLNEQTIDEMKQYIRIHPSKEQFTIAKVNSMFREKAKGSKSLLPVHERDVLRKGIKDSVLRRNMPYQDVDFLEHRFLDHPMFTYKVWQIHPTEEGAFLFGREVEHEGAKVLRLIDFVGEDRELKGIDAALDQLMMENDYEYIDFFCYGIDKEIMEQAGFFEHKWESGNIFPDFFEPFLQENGKIFFYVEDKSNLHVYKAFGDQDRPRLPR